jgi:hypothetical protein
VAIDRDYALIGAPGDDENEGVVFVFIRSGPSWIQQAELRGFNVAPGDAFGAALALDGTYAIVGAPGDDTEGGIDAGSAFIFVRDGSFWTQADKIIAADATAGDGFGASVAIDQAYAVVGAPEDDAGGSIQDAGSAYVFVRDDIDWS